MRKTVVEYPQFEVRLEPLPSSSVVSEFSDKGPSEILLDSTATSDDGEEDGAKIMQSMPTSPILGLGPTDDIDNGGLLMKSAIQEVAAAACLELAIPKS